MTTDLANDPSSLGAFAQAIEAQPVATLAATGAVIGIGIGTVLGLGAAVAVGGSKAGWIIKSAGVWGAAIGLFGYAEGRALQQWMSATSSPPSQPPSG